MTGTAEAYDVVVVGAGIIGASCGAALAAAGRRPLLIEKAGIASGTTRAGMGHVVVTGGTPEISRLCRDSQELWRERAADAWKDRVAIRPVGTLWLARGPEERAQVEPLAERLRANGARAELLDRSGILAREPSIGPRVTSGVFAPDDLVVDAVSATHQLVDEVTRRGGAVRTSTEVRRLAPEGMELADGSIVRSPTVIVAGGVESVRLLPELGLRPRKGHLVHLATPPGFVRSQLAEVGYARRAADDAEVVVSFNVEPPASGGLYLGASRQYHAEDREIEPRIVRALYERARDFLPGLDGWPVLRSWTGVRPASPDHRPFIGPHPHRPGVWVAAGHEGLGITSSLGTGCLIADLVTGRTPATPAEPFALDGRIGGPKEAA